MKKLIAAALVAGLSIPGLAGVAGAAHSSVVTPNGECHDTTGSAAGRRQAPKPKQTWQNSLDGQQTADANNDVTQADSQCS